MCLQRSPSFCSKPAGTRSARTASGRRDPPEHEAQVRHLRRIALSCPAEHEAQPHRDSGHGEIRTSIQERGKSNLGLRRRLRSGSAEPPLVSGAPDRLAELPPLVITASSQSHPRSIAPALLATLCLLITSLTIAARCYASTGVSHEVVQSLPYSPNIRTSSKLVLSRFIRSLCYDVKSDTSLIVTNSKTLLFNTNSKERNKRELKHYKFSTIFPNLRYKVNRRIPEDSKGRVDHLIVRYSSESLVDKRPDGLNASAYNASGNGSRVSEKLRIDDQPTREENTQKSTERPMPPAQHTPTDTCKSKHFSP